MTWLRDALAALVADDRVPGAVAVVVHGDDTYAEALGSLTIGGAPAQRDSLWRIASVTKPITAACVLALIQEGLLSLDETVDRLLPELADRRVLRSPDGPLDDTVPADRAITVNDLLTFTCGIGMDMGMFGGWPIWAEAERLRLATFGPPDPEQPRDADDWIAALGALPLMAQPGERWLYNTSATVLGVLAGRAIGSTFEEALQTRVLDPLGMSGTAWYARDPGRLSTAYRPTDDGLEVLDAPDGAWSRTPAMADGAAGLLSTADDVATFGRMLLWGDLLASETRHQMMSDRLTPETRARGGLTGPFDDTSWGFGGAVVTDGPRAGSYGWMGGLGSLFHVDPTRDLVVVVLGQRAFAGPDDTAALLAVEDAAYEALT